MAHPDLLGPWFHGPTWATWSRIDKAIFGEPLAPSELATFRSSPAATRRHRPG